VPRSTTMPPDLADAFGAVLDDDVRVDRHEVYARLRQESPAFRSERLGARVVTRYEDVRTVLRDTEGFRVPTAGVGSPVYGRTFLHMSGQEHAKKVGVVAREIRSRNALRNGLDDRVEGIARRTTADLALGTPVDLRDDFAMWIPLVTITELADLGHEGSFRRWYRAIGSGGTNSITDPGARDLALAARDELHDFLVTLIDERRRAPGDDLFSRLATAEYDGEPLPVDEIVSSVIFLLAAGVETTERVITSTLRHAALHPDEWRWLREHSGDEEALAAYSAEALRILPPVCGVMREATAPTTVAGVEVAEGERLCVLMASANLDETVFDDPHTFDRDRFAGRGSAQFTAAGQILPFGAGTHYCVGARLAQTEMRHAFAALAERVATITPVGDLPTAVGFMLRCPPSLPVVLGGA